MAAAAGPFVATAFLYAAACWRGEAALRHEVQQIEHRGEPLRFADLAPSSDDPALARGKSISALLDDVPVGEWSFIEATKDTLSAEQHAQLIETVDKNLRRCRAIAEMASEGKCRFSYDFATTVPGATLLPQVQKISDVAIVLFFAAERSLAASNYPEALGDIDRLFIIAELLRSEPFYVSQLVRVRLAGQGLDALQSLVGLADLEPEQAGRLDRTLASMEQAFRLRTTVLAERSAEMTTLENLGQPEMGDYLASVESISSMSPIIPFAKTKNRWWGSWVYRPRRWFAQAILLRTESHISEIIDEPGPAASAEVETTSRDFHSRNDIPAEDMLVNPESPRKKSLLHRQRLVSARLALAAVRYRKKHGALPKSLDELDSSRAGLLSGKPLLYEKTSEGFAIYDELPEQGRFEVKFSNQRNER
ncbi:MAG TPA: hypothetical protein VG826_08235 [Pirellulales bacterium]|nr:hypothetical protein [Pirellulales bacterium]